MLYELARRWMEQWELRRRAEQELALHYQEALDAQLERGLAAEDARLEAARQVGDRRAAVEACVAVWDAGSAVVPRPRAGKAMMAAVAVGAPVLLAAVLLPYYFRPLPTQAAEEFHVSAKRFQQAMDLAREAPEDVAAYRRDFASVGWPGGRAMHVAGEAVSTNFFRVQGVELSRGGGFTGVSRREIVLSDELWRQVFAADPQIAGRTVLVDGERAVVAGIAPPGFWFLNRQDRFWLYEPDGKGRRLEASALLRLRESKIRDATWARFPERELRWVSLATASRGSLYGGLFVAKGAMILLALLGLVQTWSLVRVLGFANVSLPLLARNYAFLFAKAAPPTAVAGVLWVALQDSVLLSPASMLGGVLSFVYALVAVSIAWRSLVDQRLRCHVCLRRLSMPLAQGVFGSILFNLPATEYICAWGHGTLYVPEPTSEGVREPRWTKPGGLWAALIANGRAG